MVKILPDTLKVKDSQGEWKNIIAMGSGGGGSGSSVQVEPLLTTGVEIAHITVDGTQSTLYAPNGGGGGDASIDDSSISATTTWSSNKINSELGNKANSVHSHTTATDTSDGFMSSSDKSKLDTIAENATYVIVDTSLSATSTNAIQNSVVANALAGKVNVETNKGLSTNDFDDTYKTKLDGIDNGANKTIIDTAFSDTSTNPVANNILYARIKEIEQASAAGEIIYTNEEVNNEIDAILN